MRVKRTALVVAISAVIGLLLAGPASATVVNPAPIASPLGDNTQLTLSSLGPGQGVTGFIANPGTSFDPTEGYPAANPGAGFTAKNEGFAGVIHATPAGGGAQLSMYCIDILTETNIGVGYELGTWDDANVPRVGFVARALADFYPNTNEPAALTNLNQKAAAVQATIWFFSDRYVLNTADPLHNTVLAMANMVIGQGPIVTPPPPSLTITPTAISTPVGTLAGPYTVASSATTTVTAVGADMFTDALGMQPLAPGATIASGAQIWLRSTGTSSAVLQAKAAATVPSGNVYLYDGNTPGKLAAQRLILAQTADLTTIVRALAEFQPPGSLVVNKTIGGTGAGQQGEIVIHVACEGTVLPDFTIPANTPAGTVSHTYDNLPAGAKCTVIETVDGHTSTVNVRKGGSGITVTIPSGGSVSADLTDTFATGSLIVNKTISGDGAGQQGAVTISVTCGGVAQPDFTIPAGAPAGTVSQEYTGILAGTVCTVTETANGATGTVVVTTDGSPQTVTISTGGTGTVTVTDANELVPGALVVNKTLSGSAAGQQGLIGILVACGGDNVFAFLIPPGTPGGTVPRVFEGIPAGSTCTVTESINGSTAAVDVVTVGSGQQVALTPGGTGSVDLTNAIEPAATPPTPAPTTIVPTEPSTEPGTLPSTGGGSDAGRLTLLALAAGGVGAVLVLVTRRRTRGT